MPKQPEDLVVRILRDIQHTLATHSRRFDQMDQRFDRLERRLDEVNDGMITSLGLAGHAHVRHDGLQKELDDLKKRVKRLEAKR
jgi:predicted  nucleic acid-binding Zn-ribbon protein